LRCGRQFAFIASGAIGAGGRLSNQGLIAGSIFTHSLPESAGSVERIYGAELMVVARIALEREPLLLASVLGVHFTDQNVSGEFACSPTPVST
jgi:hypothetical protein